MNLRRESLHVKVKGAVLADMKQNFGKYAAAVALLTCLFATGCASSRGGKSFPQAPVRMTVLNDSIDPLRRQFNADKEKLRVLALFSPT